MRPGRIVFTWPSEVPIALLVVHTGLAFRKLKYSISKVYTFRPDRKFFLKFTSSWFHRGWKSVPGLLSTIVSVLVRPPGKDVARGCQVITRSLPGKLWATKPKSIPIFGTG